MAPGLYAGMCKDTVETLLARRILEGAILPGQTVTVDVENGSLTLGDPQ